jgi:hypothetical protein
MNFSVKNTNMQVGIKFIVLHKMYEVTVFLRAITFNFEIFDYEKRLI